jgi:hypothetical protein
LASVQFRPIPTSTVSGTSSWERVFHAFLDERRHFGSVVFRRLEEQLVVDGENHARGQRPAGIVCDQGRVHVDHGALQHVGRGALEWAC